MRKNFVRILSFVLVSVLLLSGVPIGAAGEKLSVDFMHLYRYADQSITYWDRVDRYETYWTDGEGNYYFFLRNIAHILSDTQSCFDVQWNAKESIAELKSGIAYTGDRAHVDWWGVPVTGTKQNIPLLINGEKITLTGYNIQGNTAFRLEDLEEHLGFLVQLNMQEIIQVSNSETTTVYEPYYDIYTNFNDYDAVSLTDGQGTSVMTADYSRDRWANTIKSYIFDEQKDTFSLLRYADDTITVTEYDTDTLTAGDSFTVPFELTLFGGFYAGEKYNYIAFGTSLKNDTYKEHGDQEVIRVVKYDKNFKRIGALSLGAKESGVFRPFDSSTMRMEEKNGTLVLHTGRALYDTDSNGTRHQMQITLMIDTATMTLDRYAGSWVSHSFNQFVRWNGDEHVLLDHGDAYPRSIVLSIFDGNDYRTLDLYQIPGATGANSTGVTVGGFEVTENNYIAAINAIDPKKARSYNSYTIEGLDQDERNVILLVTSKNNIYTSNVKQIVLTDYIGKGKLGSMPYLVKLTDDRLAVLWEEYSYTEDGSTVDNGLRYCFIDGSGNRLGAVQTAADKQLSIDCQPQCVGDKLLWFTDRSGIRSFYSIENPYVSEAKENDTTKVSATVTPETTAPRKNTMPVRH